MSLMEVEIMAPAGSFEALGAALKAGADSVYFGVGNLNMRSRSSNFKEEDLSRVVAICEAADVRSYLTINTVMYDGDMDSMHKMCDVAKKEGVTAVIAADISVIEYANTIGLEVHISTQANIANFHAVKFYSRFADVVVLARELSVDQIKKIHREIIENDVRGPNGNRVQIEAFVHGALCVAVSGKCYMSLANHNSSANRGACFQTCRRSYKVTDEETGQELVIDNEYVMSPKDLCTIGGIDRLIEAGVGVLKIEGRGRGPEYVHHATLCYREAVEAVRNGTYSEERIKVWRDKLDSVFNRGFWEGGYYMGAKTEEWAGTHGNMSSTQKFTVGKIINYYAEPKIGELLIEANDLKLGEEVVITGPTTGFINFHIEEMQVFSDGKNDVIADRQTIAKKGDIVTFPHAGKLRRNDRFFVIRKRG